MDGLRRDLVHALRTWRRTPGPIAAAIVAVALGIGANTTVFSFVSGVLIKPLPYDHPDRLVMVWQDMRARGGPEREVTSPGLFSDWTQRATSVFDALGAIRGWGPNLTGIDEPERLTGAAVSAGYFASLGIPAASGRTFSADDDRPGAAPVAVISDSLWTRRFGADRSLVGRAIELDGMPTTVIGIMPASFMPPVIGAEIWSPLRIDPANAPYGLILLQTIGRLKAGVSLEQAQAAMNAIARQLDDVDPDLRNAHVLLVPLLEDMVGRVKPVLIVLTAAVVLVLLIASANVTSLLLARAAGRAREMTIRVALGADRGRLIRQLLTESALLAAAGGALGLVLSIWGVKALVAAAPPASPRLHDVHLDGMVLLFTAILTVATAVVAGLAPALASSRVELSTTLREGGREHTGGGPRAALVCAEVATAMVLVVGAALLVRSLVALQHVDLGFQTDHLLTVSVTPPRGSYRNEAALRNLYARLIDAAARVPGVATASLTSVLPLSGMNMNFMFRIEGRPPATRPGDEPVAWARSVGADFVKTMGMRIVQGRDLSVEDRNGGVPVALVNETLARRYWPGESPLGKHNSINVDPITIVGVVGDVHHRGPAAPPDAEMYLPYSQFAARGVWIVLATTGDPAAVVPSLRQAVRTVDPNLPLAQIAPMSRLADRSVAQPRFVASVLSGFSMLAAVLALVGVYGLLSFSVSRRVREIGVRMALGAGRRAVVGLVLRQSLVTVGAGIAIGAALAAGLSQLLRTLLFDVKPGDPMTIAAMAVLIAAAGLAASYLPARRAAAIDPLTALRDE